MDSFTAPTKECLYVEGDLLSTTVPARREEWQQRLRKALPGTVIIADLSEVRVVDSTGLNLLVELYQECVQRRCVFAVRGVSPALQRLFGLCRLDRVFASVEAIPA